MFREKESLLHDRDERSRLIQDPIIWTGSHESMDQYRFGRAKKKKRFQWVIFCGVTVFSLFLFIVLTTTIMRLTDSETPVGTAPTTAHSPLTTQSSMPPPSTLIDMLLNVTSTRSKPSTPLSTSLLFSTEADHINQIT
ncbi:uncharacterized protein LOC110844011 [Folsomia candida]|uniref:Uncharacterized protein n=1 Tax=Folsomia candida TaxID=158441 RepID=A0A226EQM4_FOLCA|nr:uncharacterized protein LOC110844011 [Folsomia candida]OXA59935.1 hypothetical protein Fcan01_05176 [Folsomia candida]